MAGESTDGDTGRDERAVRTVSRRRLAPETPCLVGHLAVLCVPVALLVAYHPYPLVHPDPMQFRRVTLEMVARGELLVTWDPPLRYLPLAALYAVVRPSVALADRLAVLQAAVFSYLLVPLALYWFVSRVRSRRAGLVAVTASALGAAAGLPPTAVVWHHWQVDVAVSVAPVCLGLATLAVRAHERGDGRREARYALLAALSGGVAVNTEPWVGLFLAAGVASAWAAHLAWRALAVGTLCGALAALPLLLVPNWQVHLVVFVIDVVGPGGPLLSAPVLAETLLSPGTYGTLGLLAAAAWFSRRGHPLPGGHTTGFALLAGALTWGLFRVTTLGGIGTRGLVWTLTLGLPAVAVQAVEASPGRTGAALVALFEDRRPTEWLALYAAETAVLAVSVALFVVTFEPPG